MLRQNIQPNPLFLQSYELSRNEEEVEGDWVGQGLEELGTVRNRLLQMTKEIRRLMEF